MKTDQPDLLTDEFNQENIIPRIKLLPVWMKVCSWLFIIFAVFSIIGFTLGLIGFYIQAALYGLETANSISSTGIIIVILFIYKGITAYGLLKEKDWAIKAAQADAIIGISICTIVMLSPLFYPETRFTFRLELLALIPYLITLNKIKPQWESESTFPDNNP